MAKDAKKVWKVMESEFGWSNPPKDFHLEYFEDIIKATKKALTIPVVVGQSEQLVCENCNEVEVQEQGDWCDRCLGIDKEAN